MIGRTLAHYNILENIGSGGMGEVYLAEDTTLDRKIALKVLPPELAASRERRARFKREAKAIAALNHPNIVHVYSVEEADGVHFITMELVRGKTLRELITNKGIALDNLLDVAIPLADAVAAAHEHGVIHRDLKPENVMITGEGRVKILDFGLALLHERSPELEGSQLPTATKEGGFSGTVTYMSPEQAEGKPVDHRTDVFSLGIVLHEMATGTRPFSGDTAASTISSILKDTPVLVTDPRLGRADSGRAARTRRRGDFLSMELVAGRSENSGLRSPSRRPLCWYRSVLGRDPNLRESDGIRTRPDVAER